MNKPVGSKEGLFGGKLVGRPEAVQNDGMLSRKERGCGRDLSGKPAWVAHRRDETLKSGEGGNATLVHLPSQPRAGTRCRGLAESPGATSPKTRPLFISRGYLEKGEPGALENQEGDSP